MIPSSLIKIGKQIDVATLNIKALFVFIDIIENIKLQFEANPTIIYAKCLEFHEITKFLQFLSMNI